MTNNSRNIAIIVGTLVVAGGLAYWFYNYQVKLLNLNTLSPEYTKELENITMAGKTGTGEDPPRPDHAWFGGYAPAGKPTLVIIAFGENSGGYGGTVAAPMVKALMTTWFRGSLPGPSPRS